MRLLVFLFSLLVAGCDAPQGDAPTSREDISIDRGITMHDVVAHLYPVEGFDPQAEGVPANEVDAAFSSEQDGSLAFFDSFEQLSTARRQQALLAVFTMPDDSMALALTFSLDGKLIESLLLRYGIGNNEFRIERGFSRENGGFRVSDRRYDMEWIRFPTKGKMVLQQERHFTISVDGKGHFHRLD